MRVSTVSSLSLLLAGLSVAGPVSDKRALSSRATTFNNPVIYQDYPDLDVFRIGDVFYYSSSTFAFSPGAPVLKSYDLVNWTPVTHSVPRLNFGSPYDMPNPTTRSYVKGIWASSLRYRKSSDKFIWMGCVQSTGQTYIWTAPGQNAAANNGEVSSWNWTSAGSINKCYYDNGIFIDDDDTMYVVYGNPAVRVAQLNKDGTAEVKNQEVYRDPNGLTLEGSRMYKINGMYYIFSTKPADDEWVLKSKSPFGPYEARILVDSISGPLSNAGHAHQGGVVDTKDGKWYYVAFLDSYPAGRIPVVAPLTFDSNGWPSVVKVNNAWGASYPSPVTTSKTVPALTGIDKFTGSSLSAEWEWNHNPDTSKFSLLGGSTGGLKLSTATVTNDLYGARNTLTHRIIGPKSSGTFRLDISKMASGDRAGAVLFRDTAAYIGIHKSGSTTSLVMVNGLELNADRTTKSTGTVVATGPAIPAGSTDLYLRIQADITPAFGTNTQRQATFWYSTDGSSYKQLGPSFGLANTWQFFTGFRYGVFNFATSALGGSVTVKSFEMQKI
ncbi:glycoside hydrolase family 43 protein [Bipolaris zeicola 26-R-13]|uniref:Glycoside hydrolase family 43 protein n=1 Tax=Cochliobolus carbonum (strain 26-R-13) TaxID=930089 RepID=W6YKU0_COCC2|nr:glycoside hydrolase family 43 protein [Bipolaris zeicola 26-R-13]EUC38355.1 glycoside hydrolase family 43 protein [Bipolaris zeicola 26-R-13]